ncbi:MAG: signal peptidase I [Acidimicrobiaceae bacterium]|nr:signal peptidase I [Acidimicrobiaceae bacterium]
MAGPAAGAARAPGGDHRRPRGHRPGSAGGHRGADAGAVPPVTGPAAARPGDPAEPSPADSPWRKAASWAVGTQPPGTQPPGTQPPGAPADDAAPVEDPDGPPPAPGRRALSAAVEWLVVLVCALGLALLLKAFLVEVFIIPSGSMEPTLVVDNRVVVYKLGYRLHDVNRGDVVVFDNPGQGPGTDDLIKRVVALEGETFEIRDGSVHIDGARLEEPYLQAGEWTLPKAPIRGCVNEADSTYCEVPEGTVIVLGDSREDSRDSRYFGPVDVDDIVGRAFMKIWPPNDVGGL